MFRAQALSPGFTAKDGFSCEHRRAPPTASYVEAHGTGPELGDPLEAAGLVRALTPDRAPQAPFAPSARSRPTSGTSREPPASPA
ncbi:hypothetical protein [Kitasatospora purpeofusca]|uniref:hypothetical protein n=1 Tax=Kitasatospora purpeofusca TaxID=67352 RepID=UPI0039A5B6F5